MSRVKRPNFLLFITDQHRADHLGCYGNPQVKTPHIDALAAHVADFHRDGVARHLEYFRASSQDDDQCTGNGREDEFAGAHRNLQATQDLGTISGGSRLTETI